MPRINQTARAEALAVADGRAEHASKSKIAFYGYLAQVLRQADLGTFMFRGNHDSLVGIQIGMSQQLQLRIRDAYNRRPQSDLRRLESAGFEHTSIAFTEPGTRAGKTQLVNGVNTAMHVEISTLATIARLQARGSTVSRNGLYKSRRVPAAFAMLHMPDLKDLTPMQETWEDPEGFKLPVFRDEVVELSHNNGLALAGHPLPSEVDPFAEEVYGPAIGCPVTMIRGAMEHIHRVAVDAALEAGLLKAS